ncbi:unnamed protein product, partial [Cladocopium goreaui]
LFRHVLNYLRDERLPLGLSRADRTLLLQEAVFDTSEMEMEQAKYYGLDELHESLGGLQEPLPRPAPKAFTGFVPRPQTQELVHEARCSRDVTAPPENEQIRPIQKVPETQQTGFRDFLAQLFPGFRRLVVCDVGHSFATEANPQDIHLQLPGSLEAEQGAEADGSLDRKGPKQTNGWAKRWVTKRKDEEALERFLDKHDFDDIITSRTSSRALSSCFPLRSPELLFPIHVAAKEGNRRVVRILLQRKVDPQQRSSHGRSPLEVVQAASKSKALPHHLDIIQLLENQVQFFTVRELRDRVGSCFIDSA